MKDYQKDYAEYPVKCVVCGCAWVPDARHVKDDVIENCKPDNLRYLEYLVEKQENDTPQTK
ncbi:MAG: hypothetical protein ACREBR_04540 [bacterium]